MTSSRAERAGALDPDDVVAELEELRRDLDALQGELHSILRTARFIALVVAASASGHGVQLLG